MSSKSLDRFPIYARLGVPEIWCYDSGNLKIYQLKAEAYIEQEKSFIFPTLNIQAISSLIKSYRQLGRRTFRKAVKEWIKKQI